MQPLFDFIDEHAGEPFFVWFAPLLPHPPHDAGSEFLGRYAQETLEPHARAYYASISRLDARVGELVSYLERRGLRGSTLLAFVSDNGWDAAPSGADPPLGGLRGKLSVYDLGFRTPVLFSWPGGLPEGAVFENLVSITDVAPTLLDLAGAEPLPHAEGASLLPLMRGEGSFDRQRIVGEVNGVRADAEIAHPESWRDTLLWFVRTPQWHYIWGPTLGFEELYRIDRDPFETRDLVASYPEEARRFRAAIESRRREIEKDAVQRATKPMSSSARRSKPTKAAPPSAPARVSNE